MRLLEIVVLIILGLGLLGFLFKRFLTEKNCPYCSENGFLKQSKCQLDLTGQSCPVCTKKLWNMY